MSRIQTKDVLTILLGIFCVFGIIGYIGLLCFIFFTVLPDPRDYTGLDIFIVFASLFGPICVCFAACRIYEKWGSVGTSDEYKLLVG